MIDKKPESQIFKFNSIENPYNPNDLRSGNFHFHKNVISQIKEIFESHPEKKVVVIQGIPGTGKTSILKRIEKYRGILGSQYIPIYLDSQKYIGLDSDDLSISLYRDIVEKLNQFGYDIPEPDYIKGRRKKNDTLNAIFLTVDTYRRDSEVFIIIFDELDKFLENTDDKIISEYIKYLGIIEKNWSNYGLILTSDRKLLNFTNDETIKQFFNKAFSIDIEEVIEEETIKKLIVEPVKDIIIYDDDSIQRIIWYSGKKLYFQQLICQYIIDYMNEQRSNHCIEKNVDEVVQKILTNPPKTFSFAWENKLSSENRLIASALADECFVEKKQQGFSLTDNKLLVCILGNKLDREIEKLHGFGYINRIDNYRYFTAFPFKIPLYGEWIKKEHPFIKTVIEEIDSNAEKIDLSILTNEIAQTSENQLLPLNKEKILAIAQKWLHMAVILVKEKRMTNNLIIKDFLSSFAKHLDLDIKENPMPDRHCFTIGIKNLMIGIMEEALCFIQNKPNITKEELNNIEEIATQFALKARTNLTLFFYFYQSDRLQELVKKSYLNLIPINETDLKKITLSDNPQNVFKNIILSKLSLDKVSPYQIAGPVRTIFYGRSDIINRISNSTNRSYSIVGSRKIGKTSLLLKISDNPPPDTSYIFMSLETEFNVEENETKAKKTKNMKKYKIFLKSLEYAIEHKFKKKVDFRSFFLTRELSKLPKIIHTLSKERGKIIFILDEIDGLITFDQKHDYKLLRLFRSMSQANECQFVFAGFKELYQRKRDINNPLYNFCEEIILQPLEEQASLDLITKPMQSIGVHYQNEENRKLILGYTACHPNLLQFFCKHLIEKVERHPKAEDRRTIFLEDIEKLFDTTYESYIIDDVYLFYNLSDLNKLILILIVEGQPDWEKFSEDNIRDILIGHGIKISREVIHQSLKSLVMQFILWHEGKDKYKLALSVFPEILRKRIDEEYKNKLIKEIKSNERKTEPI